MGAAETVRFPQKRQHRPDVDGVIESPKTRRMTAGMPRSALVSQRDVADAVRFLATQTGRGLTHELVITPAGAPWIP